MQPFHTDHPGFKNLLLCFSEYPKIIPAFSFMVCDENKPLLLVCLYQDAGIIFLHGMFRARNASVREVVKSIKFVEKYLNDNLFGKYPVIVFTERPWLKKLARKNNFLEQEVSLLVKGIQ